MKMFNACNVVLNPKVAKITQTNKTQKPRIN